MNASGLIVIAVFGMIPFITYQAIANPTRAEKLEGPTSGEGGYYLTLHFFFGIVPLAVVRTFATLDDHSPVYTGLTIWLLACLAWGLLGMFLPFPILKWFVPPAYRTETEHIYKRPVIGLKRVNYLTYPDDEVSTPDTSTTGDSDS